MPAAVPPSAPSPPAPSRSGAAVPWVLSTYFAEGLPYSIVHQVAAQLFAALGSSLESIGHTSLYGLAWNLKFAWSPLVDRLGTTRRWLVVTEAALGIAVAALAWPAQRGDLRLVARGLVGIAVLAATHDIAIDGFYLRALGQDAQAALSGLRAAAFRVALFVGTSVLVVIAGRFSWRACFLAAGAILLVLALGHALLLPAELREPTAEPPAQARFVDAFASFLTQPQAAVSIAFILVFRAGDALVFAMSVPLQRELGLQTEARGVLAGVGTIAVITGATAGGAVIARLGLGRTLLPIATVQSLAILLYVALAAARPALGWIAAAVIAEQLVVGVGTAAFMVFVMRRATGKHKASHFAMATALMSVAHTVAGAASGHLAARLGFPAFFAVAFVVSLPGIALSRVVPRGNGEGGGR